MNKIYIKGVVSVVLLAIYGFWMRAIMPVMTNEIAIKQMENNNDYFLELQKFEMIRNGAGAAVLVVILLLFASDIIKFIKQNKDAK